MSQNNNDFYDCGTTPKQNSYLSDKYFGDNQKLVDILLTNNVNINSNYLQEIQNGENQEITSERFTSSSTSYEIPVKIWIYKDNNGLNNISISQAKQIIGSLNNIFSSNANIRFYMLCDIGIINNTNYNNGGEQYYDNYISENWIQGAINIHFIKNSHSWGGKANFPWNSPNFACVVETQYEIFFTNISAIAKTLAHEVGHTLGLYHTHHSGRQYPDEQKNEDCGDCYQEAVSRSKRQGVFRVSTIDKLKCEVNGDYLCDTEADPALYWPSRNPQIYYDAFDFTYNSNNGKEDNWNDTWNPSVANIMGYATNTCQTDFTPLQIAKMYGYLGDIGINYPSINISGPNALCNSQTATYTVNTLPGATTYIWEVPSHITILPSLSTSFGQGTPSIKV